MQILAHTCLWLCVFYFSYIFGCGCKFKWCTIVYWFGWGSSEWATVHARLILNDNDYSRIWKKKPHWTQMLIVCIRFLTQSVINWWCVKYTAIFLWRIYPSLNFSLSGRAPVTPHSIIMIVCVHICVLWFFGLAVKIHAKIYNHQR